MISCHASSGVHLGGGLARLVSRAAIGAGFVFNIIAGCSRTNENVGRSPASSVPDRVSAVVSADLESFFRSAHRDARLSARRNTPWELIHAAIGLGLDAEVAESVGGGVTRLSAYLSKGKYLGDPLWDIRGGRLHARRSSFPGEAEYHANQFLAYFAMLEVPLDFPLYTGARALAVRDLLETAQVECELGEPNAYTLLALAAYWTFDDPWQNTDPCAKKVELLDA